MIDAHSSERSCDGSQACQTEAFIHAPLATGHAARHRRRRKLHGALRLRPRGSNRHGQRGSAGAPPDNSGQRHARSTRAALQLAGHRPRDREPKVKDDGVLSQDESERALGIACLVGQVQKIVSESGEIEGFDAARWTAQWLEEPNAALGGKPPGEFMDTGDGRALVAGLVAQMQSGAYA